VGFFILNKTNEEIFKKLIEDKNVVDKIRFTCEELYCSQPFTDSPRPLYDKLNEIVELACDVRYDLECEISNLSQ
jgi:hypothetical protein